MFNAVKKKKKAPGGGCARNLHVLGTIAAGAFFPCWKSQIIPPLLNNLPFMNHLIIEINK